VNGPPTVLGVSGTRCQVRRATAGRSSPRWSSDQPVRSAVRLQCVGHWAAVVASVAAGVVIVGCSTSGLSAREVASTTPRVPPTAVPHSSARRSASAREQAPSRERRCRPAQLTASVYFTPAGMATDFYRITIRDGGAACALRGRPEELVGVEDSGARRELHPGALTAASGLVGAAIRRAPADLDSTHSADVLLVAGVACAKAQHADVGRPRAFDSLLLGIDRQLIPVAFAGGPEPSDRGIAFPCGVAMSAFHASYALR
jgi:hypothetical protein